MTWQGTLNVGVAQLEPKLGETDHNLDRHLELTSQAQAQGLDVLVFPELSLTGYAIGDQLAAVAMYRTAEPIRRLAEAAGDVFLVVGLAEETDAAQFYNTALVLRRGEVVHVHRKLNLANYGHLEEGKLFAQGRYVEAAWLERPWRAAVLTCADVWNPALVYLAALHAATVLIVPINSSAEAMGGQFSNPSGWDVLTRYYAMVYGLPVVVANRVGREGSLTFWGGSRILDPSGAVLAEAGEGEELLTAELDYEQVRKARLKLPTVRDSNLALVGREIRRLEQSIGVPENVREN